MSCIHCRYCRPFKSQELKDRLTCNLGGRLRLVKDALAGCRLFSARKQIKRYGQAIDRYRMALALDALDLYLSETKTIETPFGAADTAAGYQLKSIQLSGDRWAVISIYMLDRPLREKDCIREGDRADLRYMIDKDCIVHY